ncbi:MAG: manganese efflux pump [Armatimonadota bacterium]
MRDLFFLLTVAVGLGADAFSVAICVGMAGATSKQKIRLASGFGAFQFIMPIIGLALGTVFGKIVGSYASFIGGILLLTLGGIMVWKALSEDGLECPPMIHNSFFALVAASVGVSIDALAVGVAYALSIKGIHILPASAVIGIVAFGMTVAGVEIGGQIGKLLHRRAPFVGGMILVLLGILILVGFRL